MISKMPQEMITHYGTGSAPAKIVDIGGGPEAYSCWLAGLGYEVHLVDALTLHVEQARRASDQSDRPLASCEIGDARRLEFEAESFDAALILGPLYHLTERNDRIRALREARRVVRAGGVILCAVISRFASTFDGIARGFLDDPEFQSIVEGDLREGQHRNPNNRPHYFTTAFFHHPDEIRSEIEEAGLAWERNLPVEGPFWAFADLDDQWRDAARREILLKAIRSIENEPSLIGASAHIIGVARKSA
jgi:ubiquinone/menaquinone biosynthesis C-methylase UbiE